VSEAPPTALGGLRVLDLATDVAGAFCARLFADNGADVVLVEPPGGSPLRSRGPFATVDGERVSCLFWHLNLGKRGFGADLGDEAGRAALAELAAGADVVVIDAGTAAFDLPADGPRVVCDLTGFGRDGVLADWRGGELVFQALSGTMFENGLPGRAPLHGVGDRASYAAGAIGYSEALATLLGGGAGRRRIDVSVAEVAASMNFNRATQFSYNGTIEGRDARTIPRAIVPCADGWAAIFIYDHRWAVSCRALGLDDLVEDPRFVTEHERLAHWDEFIGALEERLRDRPVDEVLAAGQAEKVVVAKAVSPLELGSDPQLRSRGFWDRREGEALPRLGPMLGFSATPQVDPGGAQLLRAAPTVDWRSAERPALASPPAGDRPLRGIRVLDLTTAWSGPMSTRLLAALGAEVTKVEGPGRIDDWRGPVRGGLPNRYPDDEPGEEPYNRCYQFNTQNHDKLGVALDLKDPAGIDLATRLAAGSDVLIANFSAGTLERMGLGWERLHEVNPRLILVEMPAYGGGGPFGSYVALGPSMEMMGGMGSMIGYGDGRPTTTGPAYLDPIGGFNALAAILTALQARERTGAGQRVELAQREAAMHWIGEWIVAALANDADAPVDANHSAEAAPHGAYRCAGEEEWIAIAAPDEAAWAALREELELGEVADGSDLSTLAARKSHEGEIDAAIAARVAGRDKHELAARLQARGVAAAPVANARDLHDSEFLRERGLLQTVAHPRAGTHLYQGVPLHIEGFDLTIGAPAPCFGQDTEEVLGKRLGSGAEELAELRERGVIADHPRGAQRTPAHLET
jgi:crotonobetainyl-CoA:carnitine CoA-transferase CaiB-like acyl-CoA transferase